jgi:uncharacterized membrane protein YphA (DoxX/SURF4 family)
MQGNPPSWGLVLVRIVVGYVLLSAGFGKLQNGVSESLVLGTREGFEHAPAFVREWGENVVLVHAWFFAHLIMVGELLGGTALFLGALTRPAGFAMTFMFLNFVLVGPEPARSLNIVMSVCCFACAVSRAGRRAGADVFLDERLPMWLTWTRSRVARGGGSGAE